jgi:hypothetical protein
VVHFGGGRLLLFEYLNPQKKFLMSLPEKLSINEHCAGHGKKQINEEYIPLSSNIAHSHPLMLEPKWNRLSASLRDVF